MFKGPKTTNERISDADVVSGVVMIAKLKEVFKDHDAVVTHVTSTQMSHNIREKAILGLLHVQVALRLSLRMDIIQKSFQKNWNLFL